MTPVPTRLQASNVILISCFHICTRMFNVEIAKDEATGKTVIRAKSGASQRSKAASVVSRRSSQRSLVAEQQQATPTQGQYS